MYGSNSDITLRYHTKEYLDSILDGRASHNGQYGLYYDLSDLCQRMIDNGWYQKYHRTLDELFKEYLLNPTDRMFYKDETSGKWEYCSKDIEDIAMDDEAYNECFDLFVKLIAKKGNRY